MRFDGVEKKIEELGYKVEKNHFYTQMLPTLQKLQNVHIRVRSYLEANTAAKIKEKRDELNLSELKEVCSISHCMVL